jgi:type IV pilus assembly protein PilC
MFVVSYLVFVGGILAGTCMSAWVRQRRSNVQALVQTLALIVGQNLPLGAGLRAAARHEPRRLRNVLRRIAHHLDVGDTLSTALKTAYPACPGDVVGAIQAGERGGTLPSVLRSLSADLQRTRKRIARISPAAAYCFLFLLVVPPLVLGIATFLLPKFRDIFMDFGVSRFNPLMEHLLSALAFFYENSTLVTFVLLALIILGLQLLFGRILCPRVPDRFQWLPALSDTVAWHLPVLRRISETRSLSRQLPIIQAAIRAGHDIAPAARQAACVDANYHARRRMRRWAERIEDGGEPTAQARALRFPRAVCAGLGAARGRDELTAALDYLCAYYRSLLAHWEELLASATLPLLVLVWGLGIGYVACSIMLSLYAIVDTIMADVY